MTERPYGPTPEKPVPPDLSMAYLAEHFGFVETDEMAELRLVLIEAMASGSELVPALVERYQMQAEAFVDAADNPDAMTARRVGANIAMALIRIEAGRVDDGIEDLWDVLDDMDGLIVGGHDELAAVAEIVEAEIRRLMPDETGWE